MSRTLRLPPRSALSRRSLLTGALGLAAAGLAGCASEAATAASTRPPRCRPRSTPTPNWSSPSTRHRSHSRRPAQIGKLPFQVKDWPNITAGPDVIQGFRARSIDLASNAGIPPIQARAINVDAKIVAVQTKKVPQYTYATAPGAPVTRPRRPARQEDRLLAGAGAGPRRAARPEGTGPHPKDVELVTLPSTQFLVALQTRQVDVAPLGEPVLTKYLDEYGKDGATAIPMTAVVDLTILWAPAEVLDDARKLAAVRAFIPLWAQSWCGRTRTRQAGSTPTTSRTRA